MAQLQLRGDLSYCKIDDHLIFLDIQNDRYFRLVDSLESALLAHLSGGECAESSIRALVEREILVNGPSGRCPTSFSLRKAPTRSAMEEVARTHRTSIGAVLDTFALVCSTQLQLKTIGLKKVIDGLISFRRRQTSKPPPLLHEPSQILDATAAFMATRRYVPIDTCCLLDSIAMVKFLAKRALHADHVFGVTAVPFSAHCWVQSGTMVLNDALGHALAHTPIRTI